MLTVRPTSHSGHPFAMILVGYIFVTMKALCVATEAGNGQGQVEKELQHIVVMRDCNILSCVLMNTKLIESRGWECQSVLKQGYAEYTV